MSELLSCPFCGGEAEVYEMQYGADGQYSVFGVFCVDDSNSELIGLSKYQHGHFIDNFPTPDEAIAAWNSRAERTCKMQPSPFTDWAGLNMRIVAGWYCENCGECCLTETTIDDDHPTPNYCPNCGARVVE